MNAIAPFAQASVACINQVAGTKYIAASRSPSSKSKRSQYRDRQGGGCKNAQPVPTGRGAEKPEGSDMPGKIIAFVIALVCGSIALPAVFSQSQSPATDDAKLRERAMK